MKQSFYATTILLFGVFLFQQTSHAQPATIGCHLTHQNVRAKPLTQKQKRQRQASIERSDTFDIVHYDIELDVTKFDQREISGKCAVSFRTKMPNIDYINLDLLDMNIDRVHVDNVDVPFSRFGFNVIIDWPETIFENDTNTVIVEYSGRPTVSEGSFGGFYFEAEYAYNLGIDLIGEPHNFGRSWFPCFDNFVERATYEIALITRGDRKGYAVGDFMGEEIITGDTIVRRYHMQKQLPTYLVGVAVSNYTEHNYVHNGVYGNIPVQLVARPQHMADVQSSLAFLPDAIDCLEYWYGPYVWNRVGYVITLRGAMEHSSCIAYPQNSATSGLSTRLMTHELCHHWWGNIITINYAPDMWIKEGNAEYGAHLIEEFIGGKEPFRTAVRNNHYFVLTTAHEEDGAYLALSPLSQENTYGRHTYYRGASMLHNMRAYLGDTLFRNGQTRLLNDNAFSYLNAQSYRDQMSAATGVDMTPFFDDWIFSPGYSDFYVQKFEYSPATQTATIHFGQNQYQSGHFHDNVPLPITLHFDDASRMDTTVLVGGESDSVSLGALQVAPIGISVNRGHVLNMAMFEDDVRVTETGQYKDSYTTYRWNVDNLIDTFQYVVEHHLTGPTGDVDEEKYRLSTSHFWHVVGNQEGKFEGSFLLFYDDGAALGDDADLTSMSEDSIVLMYRPNANHPWEEYEDYNKIVFLPTDGKGSMNLSVVRNGDYTFANQIDGNVGSRYIEKEVDVSVYPNPATEAIQINLKSQSFDHLQLFTVDGKLLRSIKQPSDVINLPVEHIPRGEYILLLSNEKGADKGVYAQRSIILQ